MKLKLHIPETEKTIKVKDITGGLARGFLGPSPRIIFSVNLEEELLLCYATNIGANCIIPESRGNMIELVIDKEKKEQLWDKYYTNAPAQQRQFVRKSRIVKRA